MSGSEGGGKEGKGEENRAVAVQQQDPKNVAELTNYIQNMLQQMQDRWGLRRSFFILILGCRFQTMSDQIISRIDDMGSRIDDLEHNINDLMAQVLHFQALQFQNNRFQAGQSGAPPALENKDQGDPK